MDVNNNGTITYDEFIEKFKLINTMQLLKKVKAIVRDGSNPETLFNKYCSSQDKNRLSRSDFSKLIKFVQHKVTPLEIDHLYRHFDVSNKTFITKKEFLDAFEGKINDKSFIVNIEDMMKPFGTKL